MSKSFDDNSPALIRLMSNDGKEFQILERIALMSQMINYIIQEDRFGVIPVPNVDGKNLAMIIEYCDYHSHPDAESKSDKAMDFDSNFLKNLDRMQLMNLTLAANFLEVPGLLEILFKKHADNIKDLSVEGVREYFGIESDLTKEEEAKIREENSWAFS